MTKLGFAVLFLSTCFAQTTVCPRHIETPKDPPLARSASIMGRVKLTLELAVDGTVAKVETVGGNPLLQKAAAENIKLWTFEVPPFVPFTQVITYDYGFDQSLPGDDGTNPIVKVSFDLPDRVTIVANVRLVEP